MRRADLRRSCIVDATWVYDYLRTITLAGEKVRIAYDNRASHELQEGGFYFTARFASVGAAVTYLEEYLGRPFGDWTLYARDYVPADFAAASSCKSFWTALREDLVDLPHPDLFTLANSEGLRDRLPFPSRYRQAPVSPV